ncbi:MAG: restriction endonuclease [Gemmatimonadota bacterium]|nr:MAG: restriction endonuclease [Gemmatimonadota bacterium]
MSRFWMVRAGRGGALIEDFEQKQCVAVGWGDVGEVESTTTVDDLKERLRDRLEEAHPSAVGNIAAMIWKFAREMELGDKVVTYDPSKREYLLGEVNGEYKYEPGKIPEHEQQRPIKWLGRVSRDDLSTEAKNTLGGTLTVFEPGQSVLDQIEVAMNGAAAVPDTVDVGESREELTALRYDELERSHEFIKDRIVRLAPEEMEVLVATILRAMGYKARVSPAGPDRGRDVIASPDGLGLQEPRIVAEVKHRRRTSMGSQEVRSFLGALRPTDRGLYVSTGGFSREARYEAERSAVPITLIDLDDLSRLVVEHYEAFDFEGRAMLPLVRVYWPAS